MDEINSSSTVKPLYRVTRVIWLVASLLEVLLAFRFLLKLFAANAGAGFSSFIYGITGIFASPFMSVFGVSKVQGSVFEWTTLLAMAVYWLIALGLIKMLVISKPVSKDEASEKLNRQDV